MSSYQKTFDLALGLAALLVWFVLHQILLFVAGLARLPVWWGGFSPLDVLSIGGAVGGFWWARRHPKIRGFGIEAVTELSKVNWPTQKETLLSTGVVLVMVTLVTIAIFLFDLGLGYLAETFLDL